MNITEENRLFVNRIDFAAPCKSFNIYCSVTEEERLPVVTEFVLRLIRTTESVTSLQLQNFFGFTPDETIAVIDSLIAQKLIAWGEDDESLVLTEYAASKFDESSDLVPRFTKVEPWSVKVDFDLVSFSFVSGAKSADPGNAIVLPVRDEFLARSNDLAAKTFSSKFFEYVDKNRKAKNSKIDLYKISSVKTAGSYFHKFSVDIFTDPRDSAQISREVREPNRSDLADHVDIILATTDALEAEKNGANYGHFVEYVSAIEDPVLAKYLGDDSFLFEKYLMEVVLYKHAGYHPGTVPVFGPLYNEGNISSFTKKLDHAIRKVYKRNHSILPHLAATWIAPSITTWGRNSSVFSAQDKIDRVINKYNAGEGSKVKFLFHADDHQREWEIVNRLKSHVRSAFSHRSSLYGGSLEIILVPGVIASTVFHYVPTDRPYLSFPVGYITTNARKVQEISSLIERHFHLSGGEFTPVIPRRPKKSQFSEICPEFEMIRYLMAAPEEDDPELLEDEVLESELAVDDESEGEDVI